MNPATEPQTTTEPKQQGFDFDQEGVTEAHVEELLALLATEDARGASHVSRETVAERLGWDLRMVRKVGNAAGGRVIRGQKGYTLFTPSRVAEGTRTAGQIGSAIKQLQRYQLALLRRAHELVGAPR